MRARRARTAALYATGVTETLFQGREFRHAIFDAGGALTPQRLPPERDAAGRKLAASADAAVRRDVESRPGDTDSLRWATARSYPYTAVCTAS